MQQDENQSTQEKTMKVYFLRRKISTCVEYIHLFLCKKFYTFDYFDRLFDTFSL